MSSDIILLCASLVVGFQLTFQLILFYILAIKRPLQNTTPHDKVPLSIIVCARNEEKHLDDLVKDLLNQEYQEFELVLVDDNSTDQTRMIIQNLEKSNQKVRSIILSDRGLQGKKAGITEAIHGATHDHLVFTDADCRVYDTAWLSRWAAAFSDKCEFLIGTGGFVTDGTWISNVYQLEATRSAMFYHAACRIGFPYMCVGRSMGYTKSIFHKAGGFKTHETIPGGSDDLLLLEAKQHTGIRSVPQAITGSSPPQSLGQWVSQKKRHLSVGGRYPLSVSMVLMINEATTILLIPVFVLGLLNLEHGAWVVLEFFLFLRVVAFYLNLRRFDGWVKNPGILSRKWWLEWPMSCWNALISVLTLGEKEVSWKTRK